MKNGMSGRTEKRFRFCQQVWRPRSSGDHNGVAGDPLSIFEEHPFNGMVVFIESGDLCVLAQFDAERLCVTNQCRDYATAFRETRFRIEEAVMKSFLRKCREPLMKLYCIEPLDWMSMLFQHARAFVVEIAWPHWL